MDSQEQLNAIALTRICGFNMSATAKLYKAAGSATDLRQGHIDEPTARRLATPRIAKALHQWDDALQRAEQEMAFCQKHAIRVLTPADPDYPRRMAECSDAPVVLYYRGTANLNARRIISVVGTRHCTPYGLDLISNLIAGLRRLAPDAVVVSGLAYGVDIAAHRRSLDNDIDTVAVLAHGLDRIYPSSHRETARQMTSHGGLLTEFMTATIPDKANFVRRNRIVAGMTDATVVVESADHGGALITASIARSYGREVFAYPGAVGATYSEGCNRLIRTNAAALITSADDLAEALGWPVDDAKGHKRPDAIEAELFPQLSPDEQKVVDLLQKTNDLQLNIITVRTGIAPGQLSALLFQLELRGIVKPYAGGTYHLQMRR